MTENRYLPGIETSSWIRSKFSVVLETVPLSVQLPARMRGVRLGAPVDGAQRAVRVPHADVAGAEPAVCGEDCGVHVEVWAPVVARRHTRATEEDLAAWWGWGRGGGAVACLGAVVELDLYGGHGDAGGAEGEEFGSCTSYNQQRFSCVKTAHRAHDPPASLSQNIT